MRRWQVYDDTAGRRLKILCIVDGDDENEAMSTAIRATGRKDIKVRETRELTCYHKDNNDDTCGYTWTYTGRRTKYATCPNCLKQVKLS